MSLVDIASLLPLFCPESIAIIGASTDPNKISGRPVSNLLANGYEGKIYPVNPRADMVQGLPVHASVTDIEGEVDLAIVAVPGALVEDTVDQCAEKGVKSVVMFSAGFAEINQEGKERQDRLAAKVRGAGMRMLGPNCMGMVNMGMRLPATFLPAFADNVVPGGCMGLVSQSGAFGSFAFVMAKQRGINFSYLISTGNEADVEAADALAFLANDPGTRVIMLYLEGARNGARLIEALQMARENRKPVVAIKLGRTDAGARAAESHTAALVGTDRIYDAVFQQYGVYRANSIEEFFDIGCAVAIADLPLNDNVGLITNSGGVGVLMSDDATDRNLIVSAMPVDSQAKIKELVPFAGVCNPIDVTAQAFSDITLFSRSMEIVLKEGSYGSVVGFQGTTGINREHQDIIRDAWIRLKEECPDILITVSGIHTPDFKQVLEGVGILTYEEPTHATRAIGALAGFRRAFAEVRKPIEVKDVSKTLPAVRPNEMETMAMLKKAGFPVSEQRLITTAERAVAVGREYGCPVAMKIVSADILHKSDIGGVRLNLETESELAGAFEDIVANARHHHPHAKIDGCLVVPMAGKGVETILGIKNDPIFGPVVMFGLGGIFVETIKDVSFRVAPFDVEDARSMIRETKASAILEGVRGHPAADVDALAQALSALSRFATQYANQIDSLDINPFVVHPSGQGAVALDAAMVARVSKYY